MATTAPPPLLANPLPDEKQTTAPTGPAPGASDLSAPASEKAASDKAASENEGFHPGWRFYVAFGSLAVLTLMAALDATSLSVALPIMAAKLNGSAIQAFWAGTSFLLTSTVFQPVIGSFSHIFGRKPLVLTSLAFFLAGAIVAAVAKNFNVVLAGRSLMGVGGGGILVLTEIIVADMVPLRLRGQWFSAIASQWAIGTVAGPLIGGAIAQKTTWRWIFWINLPFIGIGAPLVIFFLTLNYRVSSFAAKLRRVDWVGAFVFIAATTGFLVPLTWGGIMYEWTSWRTLLPLVLCGVSLIGFVLYEMYVPAEPLIRLDVFQNRTAAVMMAATFVHGLVLWCTVYYLPLYYEAVKGMSPILTGVALFPQTFTVAPASIVSGIIIAKTGKFRGGVWGGWVLLTLGCGLMTLMKPETSTAAWVFINIVQGVGGGMLFTCMTIAVQASSTNANLSFAISMFVFLRSFGQTVGVAIGGVIFQNQMQQRLLKLPLLAPMAAEYSRNAAGLVEVIKVMPHSLERTQLIKSYADSLRIVWVVVAALSGVAMVLSFATESLPLDRELEAEQGFKEKSKSLDVEKTKA